MRDQIELGARRQRRGELDGVLDRAFRQVVMLEGEDPIGEPTFERVPVVGGNFLPSAEAAGGRRSGAVNENQQGAFLGILCHLGGVNVQQISGLTASARPAVQPRLMVEAIFDRPQERLGAEPGNSQFGIILDLVLALFTQPFERFAFGRIDDRIGASPPPSM